MGSVVESYLAVVAEVLGTGSELVRRNKVAKFISDFYHKYYTFPKVLDVDLF